MCYEWGQSVQCCHRTVVRLIGAEGLRSAQRRTFPSRGAVAALESPAEVGAGSTESEGFGVLCIFQHQEPNVRWAGRGSEACSGFPESRLGQVGVLRKLGLVASQGAACYKRPVEVPVHFAEEQLGPRMVEAPH